MQYSTSRTGRIGGKLDSLVFDKDALESAHLVDVVSERLLGVVKLGLDIAKDRRYRRRR